MSHQDKDKAQGGLGSFFGKMFRKAGEAARDAATRGVDSVTGELRRAGAGLAAGIGEDHRAEELLRRNIDAHPEDHASRMKLAQILENSGQSQEAMKIFKPLVSLHQSILSSQGTAQIDAQQYLALSAILHEKTGNVPRALDHLNLLLDEYDGKKGQKALPSALDDGLRELFKRVISWLRDKLQKEETPEDWRLSSKTNYSPMVRLALLLIEKRPSMAGRALNLLEAILEKSDLPQEELISAARGAAQARLREHDYARAQASAIVWAGAACGMERVRALEIQIQAIERRGDKTDMAPWLEMLKTLGNGQEKILDRSMYAKVAARIGEEMSKIADRAEASLAFMEESLAALVRDNPDDPLDRDSLVVADRLVNLFYRQGRHEKCLKLMKAIENRRGPVDGFAEKKVRSLLALGREEQAYPALLDLLIDDGPGAMNFQGNPDLPFLAGKLALGIALRKDSEAMIRLIRKVLPHADLTPPVLKGQWRDLVIGVRELWKAEPGTSANSVTALAASLHDAGNSDLALELIIPMVLPALMESEGSGIAELESLEPDWSPLTSRYWILASGEVQAEGDAERDEQVKHGALGQVCGDAAGIMLKSLMSLGLTRETLVAYLLLFRLFDRGLFPRWSLQQFIPLLDLLPDDPTGLMAGAWLLIRLGRFGDALEKTERGMELWKSGGSERDQSNTPSAAGSQDQTFRELICAAALACFRVGDTLGAREYLEQASLDPIQRLEIMKSALIAGDYAFVLASPHSLEPSSCKDARIRRDACYLRAISAEKSADLQGAADYYRQALDGVEEFRDCSLRLKRLENQLSRKY